MEEQVNITINDGDAFFAHEATVNFIPTQFTVDFKCITPRSDPRSKKPSFSLKHNVVMLDPWHAKSLLSVLTDVINRYEKEYGEIKKPEQIIKTEKNKPKVKLNEAKTETPAYFG